MELHKAPTVWTTRIYDSSSFWKELLIRGKGSAALRIAIVYSYLFYVLFKTLAYNRCHSRCILVSEYSESIDNRFRIESQLLQLM